MSALDKIFAPLMDSMKPAMDAYFRDAQATRELLIEMDARLKRIEALLSAPRLAVDNDRRVEHGG